MLYNEEQKREHILEILGLLYEIAMRDSRIPAVVPSEEYTPESALAVRAFQETYGLPVTGEIDENTWNNIVDTYHKLTDLPLPLVIFPSGGFILQNGDSGELVYLIQILLETLARRYENLPQVTPTADFDPQTDLAVREFQRIAQLPQTGVVDRETWDKLASMMNQLQVRI